MQRLSGPRTERLLPLPSSPYAWGSGMNFHLHLTHEILSLFSESFPAYLRKKSTQPLAIRSWRKNLTTADELFYRLIYYQFQIWDRLSAGIAAKDTLTSMMRKWEKIKDKMLYAEEQKKATINKIRYITSGSKWVHHWLQPSQQTGLVVYGKLEKFK